MIFTVLFAGLINRQREKAEDESIEQMRERRLTIATNHNHHHGGDNKKDKKSKEEKKKEKKEKKKLEKEKKKEEKDMNKTATKGFALTFKRKVLTVAKKQGRQAKKFHISYNGPEKIAHKLL